MLYLNFQDPSLSLYIASSEIEDRFCRDEAHIIKQEGPGSLT